MLDDLASAPDNQTQNLFFFPQHNLKCAFFSIPWKETACSPLVALARNTIFIPSRRACAPYRGSAPFDTPPSAATQGEADMSACKRRV